MKIWLKFICTIISCVFILTGCSTKPVEDYDKVQKKLMEMESYSCEAKLKYISNHGETEYQIKQWARSDGAYRIEGLEPDTIKGNIIVSDGDMIWQYNPKANSKIALSKPDKQERVQIVLFTFINNLVKSQDVSVESANLDESLYTVLEAKIPGDTKFFKSEKLWIENKTAFPSRLEIYDDDLKVRAEVEFSNFQYNPKLENTVFSIDN